MKPSDIFLFLIGNRGAIQRVTGSWWSLLMGALLVITAGIARNYDHIDLLRNPEWIYGPFVASLITSPIVFGFVYPYLKLSKVRAKGKMLGYLSFLSIYWMTAPCAWIYAIPVESFTDLMNATRWNIAFLAIVSIWRVILVTRALQVLTRASLSNCLIPVLLPASAMMCLGSFFKGISLVGIMGGVRLPPHTELLKDAANLTLVLSFWLSVVLGVIWLLNLMGKRSGARSPLPWNLKKAPKASLATATLFVLIGLVASIPIQIKVRRNHELSTLILSNNYAEAITYASQLKQKDFSAIHYLPPDPYQIYGGNRKHYLGLLKQLDGTEPRWLRDVWIQQYTELALSSRSGFNDEERLLLERYPSIKANIKELADTQMHKHLLKSLEPLPEDQQTTD